MKSSRRTVAQVPRPDGGEEGHFIGPERVRGDRFEFLRFGGLPGGHHARLRPRGGMDVFEGMAARRELDSAAVPGVTDGAVIPGVGHHFTAVDQQEAAILARGEELVLARQLRRGASRGRCSGRGRGRSRRG